MHRPPLCTLGKRVNNMELSKKEYSDMLDYIEENF